MSQFIQFTVNGLTLGSVYALIALGYSMVYGILKLLNFAHGDVFMVGSFIGFGVLTVFHGATNPIIPWYLMLLLMVLAAMIGMRCARRRDRALRLPAAPQRAAHRAADQRARRLVLPRVHRAAAVRLDAPPATTPSAGRPGALFDSANGIDIGDVQVRRCGSS